MNMLMFTVLAVFGMASASLESKYGGYTKQLFHGMYPGNCVQDGFYYQDEHNFKMCSNGNSYTQICAPGSKNSGYEKYETGADYYLHDFCDVNMVDYGYNGVAPGYNKVVHAKPVPPVHRPVPTYEVKQVEKVVKTVKPALHQPKANYLGKYAGACIADGFYYNNEDSFVMCSNGNAYIQKCAPGSRNSGLNRYQHGNTYFYNDFCDVNLVDYGYTAHHGSYNGPSHGYNGYHGYPSYNGYHGYPGYNGLYHPSPRFFYPY